MLSLSVNEFPYPSDQPPHVIVSRIELFVIPALAIDADGYRVCLRIVTDLGVGWNEIFVGNQDQSSSLDQWKNSLNAFIGKMPFASIAQLQLDPAEPDILPLQMFKAAVLQLQFSTSRLSTSSSHTEEQVLRNRSIAYFSLDA